jgi:hypothetical protein
LNGSTRRIKEWEAKIAMVKAKSQQKAADAKAEFTEELDDRGAYAALIHLAEVDFSRRGAAACYDGST